MARVFVILGSLVVAGLAVCLAASLYWDWGAPVPSDYAAESLERVVGHAKAGESVSVTFPLPNPSGQPFRILGFAAC